LLGGADFFGGPAATGVWGMSFQIGFLKPRTDFRFEVSLSRGCPLRADKRPVGGPDRPRQ